MADVAIIVPTLRRAESLERALRSLFAQTHVADRVSAIVVVDNDPVGSAVATVDAVRTDSPWPLTYVHAPRPGVATARNAGLAATDAPLIAFLDDDEAAAPGWLAALLKAREDTGADAVFGPITGRAPDATEARSVASTQSIQPRGTFPHRADRPPLRLRQLADGPRDRPARPGAVRRRHRSGGR